MQLEIIVFNTNMDKFRAILGDYPHTQHVYTDTTTKLSIQKRGLHITEQAIRGLFNACDFFLLIYVNKTVFIKKHTQCGFTIEQINNVLKLSDVYIDFEIQENLNARHALNKLIGI